MKHWKHLGKVLAVGLVLGVLLAAGRHALRIDEGVFWRGYWIAAAAAVLGAVLVNLLYSLFYQRKVQRAAALLEAGDADGYVRAIEALLRTARGQGLRTQLRLNLSAGWCEQRRFDETIALLESLPQKHLPGILGMARQLNLCIAYFESGRIEQALALYHSGADVFSRYRTGSALSGNLAALDITAALAEGRTAEARTLLEHAKAAWPHVRLQTEYRKLESMLERLEAENRPE